MVDNINIGIIGMGKMGILHTGILNSLKGTNVKAIAEKQNLIMKPIKQLLPSIGTYSDHLDMIKNEDLDLIYITTPTSFHTNIALDCVDSSIPFFVEKPLGISVDDCKPLIEEIKQKPTINMIGYSMHFVDTFRKAKEILDSGVLGELIYFNSSMYVSQLFSKGKGWRYKKETSGGGVLSTLAAHLVDLLIWYFGDVSLIEGHTNSYYSKDVEDFVHSYIVFKGGLEGYIDASWSVRNYRLPEIKIEVHGEKGVLVVSDDYLKVYTDQEAKWSTYYKQDLYDGVDFDLGGPEYTREDKHMIKSVSEGINSGLDVFDAFKVQKVVDGIYKSASIKSAIEGYDL